MLQHLRCSSAQLRRAYASTFARMLPLGQAARTVKGPRSDVLCTTVAVIGNVMHTYPASPLGHANAPYRGMCGCTEKSRRSPELVLTRTKQQYRATAEAARDTGPCILYTRMARSTNRRPWKVHLSLVVLSSRAGASRNCKGQESLELGRKTIEAAVQKERRARPRMV
jgi:hypothetical protein